MNEHADKDRILGYHIFIHFQSNPMGHMEMMPGCSRHEEPHECKHRHGAFLERGIHVRAQIPRLLNHSGSSHGGNHGRWMSMTGLFSVFFCLKDPPVVALKCIDRLDPPGDKNPPKGLGLSLAEDALFLLGFGAGHQLRKPSSEMVLDRKVSLSDAVYIYIINYIISHTHTYIVNIYACIQ